MFPFLLPSLNHLFVTWKRNITATSIQPHFQLCVLLRLMYRDIFYEIYFWEINSPYVTFLFVLLVVTTSFLFLLSRCIHAMASYYSRLAKKIPVRDTRKRMRNLQTWHGVVLEGKPSETCPLGKSFKRRRDSWQFASWRQTFADMVY